MDKKLERLSIAEEIKLYRKHRIDVDKVTNIRDLGGYMADGGRAVKPGKLIRSGNLARLSPAGRERLLRMDISHIIDFRNEKERLAAPDQNIEGFSYCLCELATRDVPLEHRKAYARAKTSYVDEVTEIYAEYFDATDMENMYVDMFREETSVKGLREMFDILLSPSCTGVLFHCNSGKDRTGVAAGLLLFVLGVPDDVILLDYKASNIPFYYALENIENALGNANVSDDVIIKARSFAGVEPRILEKAFCWIMDTYGSLEEYIEKVLLLDEEKRKKLKDKYLE